MERENFNQVIESIVDRSLSMLVKKNEEYTAGSPNPFEGFDHTSDITQTNRFDVLRHLMVKHTSSIYKLLDEAAKGKSLDLDLVQEKVTDHINYLLFFEAMIHELKSTNLGL